MQKMRNLRARRDALTFILKMLRFGVTMVQQVGATRYLIATLSRNKGVQQGNLSRTLLRDKVPCCTLLLHEHKRSH